MAQHHSLGPDDGYEVFVDADDLHGYFEHNTEGDADAGELWFATMEEGRLELTDYDGVFELPKYVITTLEGFGISVPQSFK